jgi:hypothetical protein
VRRPRVRTVDDEREVPLATYAHFADRDPLQRVVLERMLAGSRRAATPERRSPSAGRSRPTRGRRRRARSRGRSWSAPVRRSASSCRVSLGICGWR